MIACLTPTSFVAASYLPCFVLLLIMDMIAPHRRIVAPRIEWLPENLLEAIMVIVRDDRGVSLLGPEAVPPWICIEEIASRILAAQPGGPCSMELLCGGRSVSSDTSLTDLVGLSGGTGALEFTAIFTELQAARSLSESERKRALAVLRAEATGSPEKFAALSLEARGDRALVAQAGPAALRHAHPLLRADKEVMMKALDSSVDVLQHAHETLKADRDVVLKAIGRAGDSHRGGVGALQYAHLTLRHDKELVIQAVSMRGLDLQHAHETLRHDREVVLAAVRERGHALKFAHETLKADQQVAMAAVGECGDALQHAAEGLRADRETVLAAVRQDGCALRHAHTDLRADKELVIAAVSQSGLALEHAQEELRADREVVIVAVSMAGQALRFASNAQRADRELVLVAIRNGCDLCHVDDALSVDKEIVTEAFRRF